jgi:tetratricopeptide (TPR) repeat protein
LSPHGGFANFYHSDICLAQGRLDEALEAAKREIHDLFRQLALANVYHAQGRRAESNATIASLIETYADTAALQIAEAFAYRGERDQAFAWLERARAQRDAGMSMVPALSNLRGLHGDPRWLPFLEKVGLAD